MPAANKLLTLTEVANRTKISMPTLQRYKKLYQDRIPSEGAGRKQRYPKSAIPVFLELKKDELVEMAWVTGEGGTEGAETVIRVELSAQEEGTLLRLTHSGFYNEESRGGHAENWPAGLQVLDEVLCQEK